MSRFDPDKYINYQKLTENLKIVRDRYYLNSQLFLSFPNGLLIQTYFLSYFQVAATFDPGREDHLQSP